VSNRVTLAQLSERTAEQVSTLPIEHLAMLLEELTAAKLNLQELADRLNAGLGLAFHEHAAALRQAEGKQTGTVSVECGDYVVRCDLPAKVEWDQTELARAVEIVKSWGDRPEEYVKAVLSVPESRYKAWPEGIRKIFEPARTLSTGRPAFKIEAAKRRAA
jgi:hypothetical protein